MSEASSMEAWNVEPRDLWSALLDQLQEQGVLRSRRLRRVFEQWPRHLFVEQSLQPAAAGADLPLSIGHGQTISQPQIVVKMTALLCPRRGEQVLDIGVGSGWQAAILQECVGIHGRVVAVERVAALVEMTKRRFEQLGLDIEVIHGDATTAFPEAKFDVITCAAGCDREPETWKEYLHEGGRMVIPRTAGDIRHEIFHRTDGVQLKAKGWDDGPMHQLVRVIREQNGFREERHGYGRYVPLVPGVTRS